MECSKFVPTYRPLLQCCPCVRYLATMHGLLTLQSASLCSSSLTLSRPSPAKSTTRRQPWLRAVRSEHGDRRPPTSEAESFRKSQPSTLLVERHEARLGTSKLNGFELSCSHFFRTSAAVAAIALLSLGNPVIPANTDSLTAAVTSPLSIGRASAAYDRPMEEYDREKLLEQNKRMQAMNQVPDNFPGFIRQGQRV